MVPHVFRTCSAQRSERIFLLVCPSEQHLRGRNQLEIDQGCSIQELFRVTMQTTNNLKPQHVHKFLTCLWSFPKQRTMTPPNTTTELFKYTGQRNIFFCVARYNNNEHQTDNTEEVSKGIAFKRSTIVRQNVP